MDTLNSRSLLLLCNSFLTVEFTFGLKILLKMELSFNFYLINVIKCSLNFWMQAMYANQGMGPIPPLRVV